MFQIFQKKMEYNLPPIPGIQPSSNDSLRKLYHMHTYTSSADTHTHTRVYPYDLFPYFLCLIYSVSCFFS